MGCSSKDWVDSAYVDEALADISELLLAEDFHVKQGADMCDHHRFIYLEITWMDLTSFISWKWRTKPKKKKNP